MSLTPELADRLRALDTPAVCDAAKSARVLGPEMECRSSDNALVGTAFTVRCQGDHFGVLRALEQAGPGDVLVIEGGRHPLAYAGELFAETAIARELAGIVLDGGYRDIDYVENCPLPIFSTYVHPMTGTTKLLGEIGVPVTVGGVEVRPGDVLVADRHGIVVLDPSAVEAAVEGAERVVALEDRVRARLAEGARLGDCLNSGEHAAKLAAGEESALRFTV